MKVLLKVTLLSVLGFGLVACGEDAEKEKFRKALVEKALNDDTRKEGDAFLAENKTKEDVVTTKSGLQFKVLKAGQGAKPSITDTVTVHYEGKRLDGHVFDSSYKRGEPATFPLNRVIKGWTEGVSDMQKGEQRMLYIPPELAYGAVRLSDDIPPNSTLIFKVELIDFRSAE